MWQFTAIVVGRGWLVDVTTWVLSARLQGVLSPWASQQQARAELRQSHQCSSHWGAWPRTGGRCVAVSQGTLEIPAAPFAGEGMVFWEEGGSVVGERSGLTPPPGELGFSLPGLEGLCLEGDSKPGTILMSPRPTCLWGSLGCFCPCLGFTAYTI